MLEIIKYLLGAIAITFLVGVLSTLATFIYFLLKDYVNRFK
jgi:hypothetical protein|nr:MAG TPA: hypothetical protein [Caudoviricetes sp.]